MTFSKGGPVVKRSWGSFLGARFWRIPSIWKGPQNVFFGNSFSHWTAFLFKQTVMVGWFVLLFLLFYFFVYKNASTDVSHSKRFPKWYHKLFYTGATPPECTPRSLGHIRPWCYTGGDPSRMYPQQFGAQSPMMLHRGRPLLDVLPALRGTITHDVTTSTY